MFGGGGGMNPRKMEQMMERMGIDVDELDATEVVIRTPERELVFADPEVTRMDARGQETYQIVGSPTERDADGSDGSRDGIPAEDVQLVATRADVDEATARETLERHDGDLAAAVDALE